MSTTQMKYDESGRGTSGVQAHPIRDVMRELQCLSWWRCLDDKQKEKIEGLINDLLKKSWFTDMSLSQKVEVTGVLFQHENLKDALRRTSQSGQVAITPVETQVPAVINPVPPNKP